MGVVAKNLVGTAWIETWQLIKAGRDSREAFDQAFWGRHPSLLQQQEPIATLTQSVDHGIGFGFGFAREGGHLGRQRVGFLTADVEGDRRVDGIHQV